MEDTLSTLKTLDGAQPQASVFSSGHPSEPIFKLHPDQTLVFEPNSEPIASSLPSPSGSNYLVQNVGRLKVFVGGLPQTATVDEMRSHFGRFGESVFEIEIKMDKITGRSRGFGFVTIGNCDSTRLFSAVHRIAGKVVDVAEVTETKLFVMGIKATTSTEALLAHFGRFGTVVNLERESQTSACVVYETTEAASTALMEPLHIVDDRKLDVRKAEPRRRTAMPRSTPIASPVSSGVFTPAIAESVPGHRIHTEIRYSPSPAYGAFGGYGEFACTPPPPPQLLYGALGVPSTYGFPGPVPGYDLIPGVGTSNRFHAY